MITIATADSGDWVAIYRDGKLLREGHSFEAHEVLRILGVEHALAWNIDCDPFGNRMPDELADLDAQVELGNAHYETWKP